MIAVATIIAASLLTLLSFHCNFSRSFLCSTTASLKQCAFLLGPEDLFFGGRVFFEGVLTRARRGPLFRCVLVDIGPIFVLYFQLVNQLFPRAGDPVLLAGLGRCVYFSRAVVLQMSFVTFGSLIHAFSTCS